MEEYNKKLFELRDQLNEIEKNQRKKYPLKENQQKVLDFVRGKSIMIQFDINGVQYFLNRGTNKQGFQHILKHFGNGTNGEITARDILNIANVIKNGRPLTDVELKNEDSFFSDKQGFLQPKNGLNYKVIVGKDKNGFWVISFFSNKSIEKNDENKVDDMVNKKDNEDKESE